MPQPADRGTFIISVLFPRKCLPRRTFFYEQLFSVRNNDDFVLRIFVEHFAAIFGDVHDVLDSYADTLVVEVDSRLNGEALSRYDDFVVSQGYVANLVVFQTD